MISSPLLYINYNIEQKTCLNHKDILKKKQIELCNDPFDQDWI